MHVLFYVYTYTYIYIYIYTICVCVYIYMCDVHELQALQVVWEQNTETAYVVCVCVGLHQALCSVSHDI